MLGDAENRASLPAAPDVWIPNPRQAALLASPVYELLAWGNRGGGKSDWLLMDFARDIGRGLGRSWRGIVLRREEKDLVDIIERSKSYFHRAFPGAKYASERLEWAFATGERLVFAFAKKSDDIRQFLGQEWPWQGFDELCNWADPSLYLDIQSCARSPNPKVRPRIRAATNPWGPGAAWVKERFIDAVPMGRILTENISGPDGVSYPVTRAHVRVDFADNDTFKSADPSYLARLNPSDPAKRKAWVEGVWDLSVGGFFSGIWNPEAHVIPPFKIPPTWRIDRAHDWGAAKPHCTLWFAESDGSRVEIEPGVHFTFPKGTLFVIEEIYGWNGQPNTGRRDTNEIIAADIRRMDESVSTRHGGARVHPGPADTQIFDAPQGRSISDTYRLEGVTFEEADKSPGSRITGGKAIQDRLAATLPFAEGRSMEAPGLLIFSNCKHVIRTLPTLQRDDKKPDDINSTGEDHAYDVLRYRCLFDTRPKVFFGAFLNRSLPQLHIHETS